MNDTTGIPHPAAVRHHQALRCIAEASTGTSPAAHRADERDVDPDVDGVYPPRVAPEMLTAAAIVAGLDRAGCVFVPGLLDRATAAELADGIDRAFDRFDQHRAAAGTNDPWFDAYIPAPALIHETRQVLRNGGGMFIADSPVLLERWFRLLGDLGIVQLVADVFGERPIASLDKASLRKISSGDGIEWHQDGAFLGLDNGALNLWVSLTDTHDSPGLEFVSRRFTRVVETGTGGATYDWSVGPDVIAELAKEAPIVKPHFRPGDALLFDGALLHRTTQPPPELPRTRHALETWFFRPSRFPDHQQIPLAL